LVRWSEDLVRDVRYGLRMLRMTPLISVAVVITLALGIGLDTGAFTVINGLLLRPRCEVEPEGFARLYAQYTFHGQPRNFAGLSSVAAYRALVSDSHFLDLLAAWRPDGVVVEDDANRMLAMEVSCNFFSVYGLERLRAGRFFRADECDPARDAHVVILAEEFWRDRFASDPQILGKTILLNRQPFTVIGITPLEFSGRLRGPGIWVPYAVEPQLNGQMDIFRSDSAPSLWLEGRLRPGATRKQLASEATGIASRAANHDRDLKATFLVTNGSMIEDPNVRDVAYWLILLVMSGLTLLLLVSCATVAVLLLSRAAARRREIAVRISLGAARVRILRQLLAENVLLALSAGVIGIYLALQVPLIFKKLVPRSMPHYPFTLDWHIFGYLAAVTLTAALLAGLAPALECLRQDVWASLKGTESSVHAGKTRWSLRDLLVITQVAFSVVLMTASAMFIRLELAILNADPGFETEQVLQVPVQLPLERYNAAASRDFYTAFEQRLVALPAVESIATSSASPLAGEQEQGETPSQFHLPTEGAQEGHNVSVMQVSANYFSTLGLRLMRGEAFRNIPSDSGTAVVSQSFATAFWPGKDPLDQVIVGPDGQRLRVIGIARDTRTENPGHSDGPFIYLLRSRPVTGDLLLVRFHGDTRALQLGVKNAVRELDPQMFVLTSTPREMLNEIAEQMWRLGKMLLFVALVAAGLALFGIYGVVGYSVTRRTREFGIRAALGASRRELMRLVVVSGSRPVFAGTVLGALMAAGFSLAIVKATGSAPLAPSAHDPLTYITVCVLLLMASTLAMLGHARRAARVEPLVALREQ